MGRAAAVVARHAAVQAHGDVSAASVLETLVFLPLCISNLPCSTSREYQNCFSACEAKSRRTHVSVHYMCLHVTSEPHHNHTTTPHENKQAQKKPTMQNRRWRVFRANLVYTKSRLYTNPEYSVFGAGVFEPGASLKRGDGSYAACCGRLCPLVYETLITPLWWGSPFLFPEPIYTTI